MIKRVFMNMGLFFISGIIFIIIFNVWGYVLKINELQSVSREMIGGKAIYYQSHGENLDFDTMYAQLPKEGILYNDLSWDQAVKSVLFKDNEPKPPMISGRFFTEQDIKNQLRLAIVGKNIDAGKQGQKDIIYVNSNAYEIIGVMGSKYDSKLDNAIWIVMNEDNINAKGIFTLDGLVENEVLAYLGLTDIWGEVLIMDRENIGLLEVADRKKDYWIFPMMVLITGFFYYIILLHRWILGNTNEIQTRKEMGFSLQTITKILISKSAVPCLSGIIMAAGLFIIRQSTTGFLIPILLSIVVFGITWVITSQYKDIRKVLRNG